MHILLGDIGGTNSRLAMAAGPGIAPGSTRQLRNRDFPDLPALLRAYLDPLAPAQRPQRAVLAVAAPVRGEEIAITNSGWRFSQRALRAAIGVAELQIINDFAALARSLPGLAADELRQVGGGRAVDGAPRLVIGPGTGLGVAGLLAAPGGGWQVLAGEGGHVTLAAHDAQEERLIGLARTRYGHCSAERLVSGPGLSFLHGALHGEGELPPEVIGARALAGDPAAGASLEQFFRLLGTVAGNAALTLGTFGGVYVGGGIVPRYAEAFAESGFRQRFEAKGRYRDYLRDIPCWLITAPHPALTGLAAIALHGY